MQPYLHFTTGTMRNELFQPQKEHFEAFRADFMSLIEFQGFLAKVQQEVQCGRPYLVFQLETIRNELFQPQKKGF